jgi:signal transduction histidine kinase/DNA-binding CsgD family transcriptional regulator
MMEAGKVLMSRTPSLALDFHGEIFMVSTDILLQLIANLLSDDEAEIMRLLSKIDEQYMAEQKVLIEQERKRIAREIHDGAAQQIAHVMYKLEYIQRVFENQPEVAQRELARVHAILEESLQDLRHSIASLIPPQLERQDFDAALRELFKNYEPDLEIRYDTNHVGLLPASLEIIIFRFIQEALSNVRKHAQASHVAIRIRVLSGVLQVQIGDNGKGFLPARTTRRSGAEQHIGLNSMRERIEQAGGTLVIHSKSTGGTILKARFPLSTPVAVLTRREREVLSLLVEGLTNRVIAKKLSVSVETVKSHVRHIMQKMHVEDRTQAAVRATKQRWL